jgi:hypothetical protein
MWWYLDGEGLGSDLGRGRPDLANHAICLATGHFEVSRFGYVDRVGHLDDWALCSSNRCHDGNGVTLKIESIDYLLHDGCRERFAVLTADDFCMRALLGSMGPPHDACLGT